MADRALGGAEAGDDGDRARKSPVERLLAPVSDVRALSSLVRELGTIVRNLETIAEAVVSLDREFKQMNKSVTEMRDEVKVMRAGVDPLNERLIEVRDRFERIEPALAEMSMTLHPLKRARRKLGNGSVAERDAAAEAIDEAQDLEDEVAARAVDAT